MYHVYIYKSFYDLREYTYDRNNKSMGAHHAAGKRTSTIERSRDPALGSGYSVDRMSYQWYFWYLLVYILYSLLVFIIQPAGIRSYIYIYTESYRRRFVP